MKPRVRTDIQKSFTKYFFHPFPHITNFAMAVNICTSYSKPDIFCQINVLLKWKVTVHLKHALMKHVSLHWRALDFHLSPKHNKMENGECRKIASDPFPLADFSAPAWQKLWELRSGWEKSVYCVLLSRVLTTISWFCTAWLVATVSSPVINHLRR